MKYVLVNFRDAVLNPLVKKTMEPTSVYILIAILGLSVFPALYGAFHKKQTRLSRVSALAFAFIIAGLFLSRKELLGFSLLGVGIILAVVEIIQKRSKKSPAH